MKTTSDKATPLFAVYDHGRHTVFECLPPATGSTVEDFRRTLVYELPSGHSVTLGGSPNRLNVFPPLRPEDVHTLGQSATDGVLVVDIRGLSADPYEDLGAYVGGLHPLIRGGALQQYAGAILESASFRQPTAAA